MTWSIFCLSKLSSDYYQKLTPFSVSFIKWVKTIYIPHLTLSHAGHLMHHTVN